MFFGQQQPFGGQQQGPYIGGISKGVFGAILGDLKAKHSRARAKTRQKPYLSTMTVVCTCGATLSEVPMADGKMLTKCGHCDSVIEVKVHKMDKEG